MDRRDKRRIGLAAGAHARESRHVRPRETAQRETLEGDVALEIRERVGECTRAVQIDVAIAPHYEQPPLCGRAQDVAEQEERRLVRPLQVVHQQHERA
ncbi:MAG TPA: hypothetical protein VFX29_02070, partial [Longimicrobiaceae bacterium]|nr:hypothetical protein [Longimicrobiaceae bacterium]